jgi:hypothetical protein
MNNIYHLVTAVIAVIFVASPLEAYDSHHPDPMSFLNGNHHATRHKPEPDPEENNTTKIQKWRMYQKRKEKRYVIKPEPYSLASKKTDPELLGPQRTYKHSTPPAPNNAPTVTQQPSKTTPTKTSCIGMIGQEKFDQYVEKYGGESGALHRCLILQRLQGQ